MTTPLHHHSAVAATLAWLRGHTLLAVFGVFTAIVLTVAVAQSLLTGSVLPLVFFLILGAFIVPGMLRLDRGRHGTKDTQ